MNTHELSQLIERNLPIWRRYSAYICWRLGIPLEANDVLGDVLEALCRTPEALLERMIMEEIAGNPHLRNFVLQKIRWCAFNKHKTKRAFASLELVHISAASDEDDDSFVNTNEAREATAQLRDDSFITVEPACKISEIRGSVYPIINRGQVYYRAYVYQKAHDIRKSCTTRHEAFKFLMSRAQQQ